jgi:hypothetical protein
MFTIYYQDNEDVFFIGYAETEADAKSAIEKLRANDFEQKKVEIENEILRVGKQAVEEADTLNALWRNSGYLDEMAQAAMIEKFQAFRLKFGVPFSAITTINIMGKYTLPYTYTSELKKL